MKETSKKYIAEMSCNEMKRTEGGYTLPEVVVVGSKKNFENNVGRLRDRCGNRLSSKLLVLQFFVF